MLEMRGWRSTAAAVSVACVLAACASKVRTPAPVEDRSSGARLPAPTFVEPARQLPGAENAGRPGYYTVRPGDTLIRISLDAGQNWRDIARWNNLDNPNVIEVGQVLRVIPPVAVASATTSVPATPGASATAPAASSASAPRGATAAASAASGAASSTPAASASVVATLPPATPQPAAPAGEDEVAWGWPTVGAGMVLAGFDEQRNKGLDIGGKAGDPVLAAADGRVVYAGAGLRGYGNLIILKHNNTYLSAYAHNQTLLVKEDQSVRKGQKIAEMGASDADRVKLHFEIRRQGKPVDPARYLPMR
jgi:lipoprotein NlpD